jgi:hypothetical protein
MQWNKTDCINEFKKIVSEYPDKSITRDFFRKVSELPESIYQRFFGTFSEFKVQSGFDLTSHQDKYLSNTAKHASVDILKNLNKEKSQYEGKYERPCYNRYQTIVTITDTHDINFDLFTRRVYLDTLKRVQPETIVFGGDHFDLPEFSKYFNDPRSYNLIERVNNVHQFLKEIREILPDAEFNWISGNHCHRILKHLAHSSPNMISLLNDLHKFTVSSLLGLDQFEINYISRDDLCVFNESDFKSEMKKNYLVKFDSVLFHHYPEGKKYGLPGVNGHHHSHKSEHLYNYTYGPYEWHQLGAGHVRRASFTDGSKWTNGFMISHHDIQNKRTVFEYVDTTQNFAIVGGKFYERTESELIQE